MKISTIKIATPFQPLLFKNKMREKGYDVSEIGDQVFSLTSNSYKKVISTWGLICVVKEIRIIIEDHKVTANLFFDLYSLILLALSAVGAFLVGVMDAEKTEYIKLTSSFVFLLSVSSMILFLLLRSDILRDIKKSM